MAQTSSDVETVVLVSDFANINGGQAKVTVDSAVLLADAGINVHFFAAAGDPDPALNHPKIKLDILGQNDILSEPNRIKAMSNGIWNRTVASRLWEVVRSYDPKTTVMHCHGYAKALSPSVGRVLASGILPTVYTMHEYFLACPNGGFYDYQKNEICTKRALGAACLTTHCDVRHPAHKAWRVLRQAATWGPGAMPRGLKDIIYISETQKRAMAPYLSKDTRLHHVPNPVPLPDLPPVKAHENEIFLFVGRLNPEKGGLMFAEAAREAGVKAVFVGDGAEADAIRAANPDAVITGWQTPAQVQAWIGKARALVFPSLWYEGQPLVPMEALGRGVPVVAGKWSAAHECIQHDVNGVIYERPEVTELAQSLKAVFSLVPFDASASFAVTSPSKHLQNLRSVYEEMRRQRNCS